MLQDEIDKLNEGEIERYRKIHRDTERADQRISDQKMETTMK